MKEVKLSVNIAENDLKVKSKKAIELLQKKHQVYVSLQLRGREKAKPERGELTMLKFIETVSTNGKVQSMPKLIGYRWSVIINPKK